MTKITLPKPKNQLRVASDFDDVLWPFLETWGKIMGPACQEELDITEAHFEIFGLPPILKGVKIKAALVLPNGRKTGDNAYFEQGSHDPSQVEVIDRHEFLTPKIYDDFKPYPDALDGLQRIAKNPWVKELVCLTSHPYTVSKDPTNPIRLKYEAQKTDILLFHFEPFGGKIIFTSEKHQCDIDVLIDDSFRNIELAQKEGIYCIVITRPWNAKIKDIGNAARAKNLNEAANALEDQIKKHWHPLFKRSTAIASPSSSQAGVEQTR